MEIELYSEVAITKNFPEENLRIGDVATLIDIVPHPSGGEDGAVLEIFDAVGESIAVTAVPLSAIAVPRPDQMPAVRPLEGMAV